MQPADGGVGVPAWEEYLRALLDALEEAGVAEPVRYDGEHSRLLIGEDGRCQFRLLGTYREYRDAPPELRPRIVQARVEMIRDSLRPAPEESLQEVLPGLRPMLLSRFTHSQASLQQELDGKPGLSMAHRAIGPELLFLLGYDMPTHVEGIDDARLRRWGLSFEEAFEIARQNLRREGFGAAASYGGCHEFLPQHYNGCLLLLPEVLKAFQVQGDLVALVPNRDQLLLVGSEDEAGLAWMAERAQTLMAEGRHQTGTPLRLTPEGWQPFLPPPDQPTTARLREHRLRLLGEQYAGQRPLLDQVMRARGETTYVADYQGAISPDGALLCTVCVWPDDLSLLLPRAEKVGFMRQLRPLGHANWDRVVAIAGDLMEPLNVYPERYRVKRFPTERQLRAMGLHRLGARG